MANNVRLTPALERFTRKCVRSGRYSSISEVVRSALRLLEEAEEQRQQFQVMLREAELEADRVGTYSVESIVAEVNSIIDESD